MYDSERMVSVELLQLCPTVENGYPKPVSAELLGELLVSANSKVKIMVSCPEDLKTFLRLIEMMNGQGVSSSLKLSPYGEYPDGSLEIRVASPSEIEFDLMC